MDSQIELNPYEHLVLLRQRLEEAKTEYANQVAEVLPLLQNEDGKKTKVGGVTLYVMETGIEYDYSAPLKRMEEKYKRTIASKKKDERESGRADKIKSSLTVAVRF